ncbi:MAG: PDZ domain-containing protein [Halanaerobiales bacterium]
MKNSKSLNKYISRKLELFIGLVIIFLIISYFIPTPYMVTSPGIAQELSPLITVEDGYKGQSRGDFMLTAVASKKASLLDYIYVSLTNPEDKQLTPVEDQIPPGMDMDEYLNIMDDLMEESKLKAQAIAFEKHGHEVSVSGKGASVEEVLEEGSAVNKLKKGDVIVAVNGKKIELATDAVQVIREQEINKEIELTIIRNNEKITTTLKTVELPQEPDKSSIGVLITTKDLNYDFPKEVHFDTKNIIGPSAGGVFSLEIYNQLTEKDITGGKKIAGTGTIDSDGSFGRIDGTRLKIIAAKKAEADVFILPRKNYEELGEINTDIELVPVDNFDQALEYLKNNT